MNNKIVIGGPRLQRVGGAVRWSVDVNDVELWFKVPIAFERLLTSNSDPALVALLMPSMLGMKSIVVRGQCSEDLYFNFSAIQGLIKSLYPNTDPVSLHVESLVESPAQTAPSGGG